MVKGGLRGWGVETWKPECHEKNAKLGERFDLRAGYLLFQTLVACAEVFPLLI